MKMRLIGDTVSLPKTTEQILSIDAISPIRFNSLSEEWEVTHPSLATHICIETTVRNTVGETHSDIKIYEIGKCDNLWLLADAIVE